MKKRYDADGVLWCRNCVGSDRWMEQADGGICLARTSGDIDMLNDKNEDERR